MTTSNNKISLVLLTKNEGANIKKNFDWLDKCRTIDELIVVDDSSTDDTKNILDKLSTKKRSVKIIDRALDNNFSEQRAFGNSIAKNDLIFWLDADERPSDKLIRFLNNIDKHQYNAVAFDRIDFFLGRELNHGETASQKFVRLFNKNHGHFEGAVHEEWKTSGQIVEKKLVIHHYAHQSLKSFIQKINFYTDIRAKELFDRKVTVSLFHIIFYPLGKFVHNYFIRLGFLDSTSGIIMALAMSFHSFLVRAKLWHLYQK